MGVIGVITPPETVAKDGVCEEVVRVIVGVGVEIDTRARIEGVFGHVVGTVVELVFVGEFVTGRIPF